MANFINNINITKLQTIKIKKGIKLYRIQKHVAVKQ